MELLPIGTILHLKKQTDKHLLMIVSHYPITQRGTRVGYFDYGACFYPEGLAGINQFFFNSEDIGEVIQRGYVNEDEKTLEEKLKSELEKTQYAHFDVEEETNGTAD